jgi:hypothetical protein
MVTVDPSDPSHKIERQLSSVENAVNGRQIDALIMSAGSNDIGFGDIIKKCFGVIVRSPPCCCASIILDKQKSQRNKF